MTGGVLEFGYMDSHGVVRPDSQSAAWPPSPAYTRRRWVRWRYGDSTAGPWSSVPQVTI